MTTRPHIRLKIQAGNVTRLRGVKPSSPWSVRECLEAALANSDDNDYYASRCYVVLLDERGDSYNVRGFGSAPGKMHEAIAMLWTEIVRLTQCMNLIPKETFFDDAQDDEA